MRKLEDLVGAGLTRFMDALKQALDFRPVEENVGNGRECRPGTELPRSMTSGTPNSCPRAAASQAEGRAQNWT